MPRTLIQLAVNVPSAAGVFDYAVPEALVPEVAVGQLVTAPFGSRSVHGIILRFIDRPAVAAVREILSIVDPLPVLTPEQIALAEELSRHSLTPVAGLLELFLPPGLGQQADLRYEAIGDESRHFEGDRAGRLGPTSARLLTLIRGRGPLRGRQIDRHFRQVEWRRAARFLVKGGLLSAVSVLPPARVRPKFVRFAQLAVAPEAAEAAISALGHTAATQARREKALRLLVLRPDPMDVSWVYAQSGCNLADLQELAERDLILLREMQLWRDPLLQVGAGGVDGAPVAALTEEQEQAWRAIAAGFRSLSASKSLAPFLLDGVTGSGKTELYLRAAEEAIRRGRQVIVLVPEISLTPQTVRRFLDRFPGQVGLVHSKLSEGERYDTWRRARGGALKILIGARSGLFAPLPSLGLIVLDECHDASYYQSEPPFYHAVSVAKMYARLAGALCLLGSATPTIDQRYQAESGGGARLELPRRVAASRRAEQNAGLPPVTVVDMRDELKAGQRGIFSRRLLAGLETALARGEQAILFLNRRGTATFVFCRECGYAIKCPRCDTPMTLHTSEREGLLCHHCGYERNMPATCPVCGSSSIRAYGLGSEKVETEVRAAFPGARTLRWDWETTRQKGSHELILSHFAAHRADVLVGTQMLAKGLDLPLVTLVGIVLADVGLNLPDPFAAERVFQVLTHVAGRAGRSERGGEAVLQTFSPEHYVIQAAARHDVSGFYKQELAERKRLGYPPFTRLVRLEIRRREPEQAERAARELATRLSGAIAREGRRETEVIGPVPCFFTKLRGEYRWQVILRGPDPASMITGRIAEGWRVEVEPISLL